MVLAPELVLVWAPEPELELELVPVPVSVWELVYLLFDNPLHSMSIRYMIQMMVQRMYQLNKMYYQYTNHIL